jgi:predicted metal-dependent phosphoesterase TrpH
MRRQDRDTSAYADLHTHTVCSDGKESPEALVQRAAEQGIRVLSVTDHDTVEGLGPAAATAEEVGIRLVPGIELSVTLKGREIHLLAYGVNPEHSGLQRHLAAMQEARQDRAWTIVERLRTKGVEVEDEQLRSDIASVHAVGRPHVAAALVRAGHVDTERAAFEQYLGAGQVGDVAKPAFEAADALSLVHDAGGVGVLAHPGHWLSGRQARRLVEKGLDGIETNHPSHDASLRGYYERLANGYDLLTTGGSDYHGRTADEEARFGTVGMSRSEWERFRAALS